MASRNPSTSRSVLWSEKLTRTVPVSTVPTVSWASGAQWRIVLVFRAKTVRKRAEPCAGNARSVANRAEKCEKTRFFHSFSGLSGPLSAFRAWHCRWKSRTDCPVYRLNSRPT